MLGKSQGVLFISLEEYSGFSKLVCGGYEQDLSDVFYLYRQGDFNWLKLKSLILSHGNVDYIPPAAYGEDLDQAQPEEIAGLLKQIGTESGYERTLWIWDTWEKGLWSCLRPVMLCICRC